MVGVSDASLTASSSARSQLKSRMLVSIARNTKPACNRMATRQGRNRVQ